MANHDAFSAAPRGHYARLSIPEAEIETEEYKRHLGGGKEQWDVRGRFQLFLLKEMGLRSHHQLLDVGCGPLRAGRHFVEFLAPSKYWGVDYNRDFIQIGRRLVSDNPALSVKSPLLRVLENFALGELAEQFDFVLAFSVLNHSPDPQKKNFFQNLPSVIREEGRAFVTHAWWFSESIFPDETPLKLSRVFKDENDISQELDPSRWGWPKGNSIFPILEISRA